MATNTRYSIVVLVVCYHGTQEVKEISQTGRGSKDQDVIAWVTSRIFKGRHSTYHPLLPLFQIVLISRGPPKKTMHRF